MDIILQSILGTSKLEEVGRLALKTFVGNWFNILNPYIESNVLFNPISYCHVDYNYKYLTLTGNLEDAFTPEHRGDNGEYMKLLFRCTHLNSTKTDNRLVNLMWLTASEEKKLHSINGNIRFGDIEMEVVIYEVINGVKIPVALTSTVRNAGRWFGIGCNGGLVVEDCKGRLNKPICVNNKQYRCCYYINLDRGEQIRVDEILNTKHKHSDETLFGASIQEIESILKRKEKEKREKNRVMFDDFSRKVAANWFIKTGIKAEFHFREEVPKW